MVKSLFQTAFPTDNSLCKRAHAGRYASHSVLITTWLFTVHVCGKRLVPASRGSDQLALLQASLALWYCLRGRNLTPCWRLHIADWHQQLVSWRRRWQLWCRTSLGFCHVVITGVKVLGLWTSAHALVYEYCHNLHSFNVHLYHCGIQDSFYYFSLTNPTK